MSNEIVVGSVTLTPTEQDVATLTAWHPFVDVYVDGSADPVISNSRWNLYAVTGGTRTLIASDVFDQSVPIDGQRVLAKIPGLGTTIVLAALTPNGSMAVPVKAAIVGWDPGTTTASPTNSSSSTQSLVPGPEVTFATIPWHPDVACFVQAPSAAQNSFFRIKAVIPTFTKAIAIAAASYGDVFPSRLVCQAEGGCASWQLDGSTPIGPTGPVLGDLFGSNGPGANGGSGPGDDPTIVANLTALTAIDNTTLPNSTQRFVQTLLTSFILDAASTLTVDGITIVATLSGTGRWLRLPASSLHWTYAGPYFYDSGVGNDENDGQSSGAHFKTLNEFSRRLRTIRTASATGVILNLLSNVPSTDSFNPSGWTNGEGTANSNPFAAAITLQGVRTTLFTGAFTSNGTVAVPATNTAPSATDAGIADWTPFVGKMLVTTNGSQINGRCWILKNLGAGVARMSRWSGAVSAAAPLSGATYKVVDLTTVQANLNFQGCPNLTIFLIDCAIPVATPAANLLTIRSGINLSATTCRFEQPLFGGVTASSRFAPDGCCFLMAAAATVFAPGNITNFSNSCMINGELRVQSNTSHILINNLILQGAWLDAGVTGVAGDANLGGSNIGIGSNEGLGIFDSPAGKSGLNLSRGATCLVAAPLWGSGNAAFGTNISEGAGLFIQSGFTPTLTGASGVLITDGLTTAVPKIEDDCALMRVVLRAVTPSLAGVNPYVNASCASIILPDDQKASFPLPSFGQDCNWGRANGSAVALGALTVAVPSNAAPASRNVATSASGDVLLLGTDLWTSVDYSYVSVRQTVVSGTFVCDPATGVVAGLPSGLIMILEAEVLAGGTVGKCIVQIAAAAAPGAGLAGLNLGKTGVFFSIADAPTSVRLKLGVIPTGIANSAFPQPLTSFVDWNAAPFSRNLTTGKGTRILSVA